jgi:aminocarboxymuconate-semialdehyde decarboxylase
VNFDAGALRLALDFAGVDRILAGSDYPHQIGSIATMKESLAALKLPAKDHEKVVGGNARQLLAI